LRADQSTANSHGRNREESTKRCGRDDRARTSKFIARCGDLIPWASTALLVVLSPWLFRASRVVWLHFDQEFDSP
jgi:hypothetical protein